MLSTLIVLAASAFAQEVDSEADAFFDSLEQKVYVDVTRTRYEWVTNNLLNEHFYATEDVTLTVAPPAATDVTVYLPPAAPTTTAQVTPKISATYWLPPASSAPAATAVAPLFTITTDLAGTTPETVTTEPTEVPTTGAASSPAGHKSESEPAVTGNIETSTELGTSATETAGASSASEPAATSSELESSPAQPSAKSSATENLSTLDDSTTIISLTSTIVNTMLSDEPLLTATPTPEQPLTASSTASVLQPTRSASIAPSPAEPTHVVPANGGSQLAVSRFLVGLLSVALLI